MELLKSGLTGLALLTLGACATVDRTETNVKTAHLGNHYNICTMVTTHPLSADITCMPSEEDDLPLRNYFLYLDRDRKRAVSVVKTVGFNRERAYCDSTGIPDDIPLALHLNKMKNRLLCIEAELIYLAIK